MRYLLDTSIVVALLRRAQRPAVLTRLQAEAPGQVVTSVVVAHELAYGVERSARPTENQRELATLLTDLTPLPFTREDAEAAAAIRCALARAGTPIGPYDVLIAGQAKARGLVLVTNNAREFRRVEGLATEDWLGADRR